MLDRFRLLALGETLLFFTEGLIERRDESIDVGLARLAVVAAAVASSSIDELVSEVLAAFGTGEDDVAVMALRRS